MRDEIQGFWRPCGRNRAVAGREPAGAPHHSFGVEYDANKPISLTGVTHEHRVDQSALFHLPRRERKDGKVTNWKMEGFPPSVLYRTGWRHEQTVKIGDTITMTGWQSRVGGPWGHSREVTLADGGKLYLVRRLELVMAATTRRVRIRLLLDRTPPDGARCENRRSLRSRGFGRGARFLG